MPVGAIATAMLTRAGVAKKLRCSVATVRRLERHELFPERDARGVHWFDEREVDRVRHRLSRGDAVAAQGAWLTTAGVGPRGAKLGPKALTRSKVSQRPSSVRGKERLVELESENQRLRDENAELQRRVGVLRSSIESLLEHGPIEEVIALIDAACSESE